MSDRLNGTVALVTGASSGIGAATALALADRGAAVALFARRTDRLEALAEKIRDAGGTALVLADDIADVIGYIVTRPRHVAINELLVRPTEQEA